MGDLLGIDHLQRRDRALGLCLPEDRDHARRDVQPPRLQHHGHDGKTAHQVVHRILRRPPHARMGGQRAIEAAHLLEAVAHQVEMLGFLVRRLHPVVIEAHGHRRVGEAGDHVPVQVHRVQLDMCHRMQQRDTPLRRAGTAARDVAGAEEFRGVRPGGMQWRLGAADLGRPASGTGGLPVGGIPARQRGLFPPVGTAQHRLGHLGKRHHRARTASSTSSTWPGTFTLRQTRAMVPSASIR